MILQLYYGDNCPACDEMEPYFDKVEVKEYVQKEKYNVKDLNPLTLARLHLRTKPTIILIWDDDKEVDRCYNIESLNKLIYSLAL